MEGRKGAPGPDKEVEISCFFGSSNKAFCVGLSVTGERSRPEEMRLQELRPLTLKCQRTKKGTNVVSVHEIRMGWYA